MHAWCYDGFAKLRLVLYSKGINHKFVRMSIDQVTPLLSIL